MRAHIVVLLLVVALAPSTPEAAGPDDVPIQSFFGKYEGRTLFPMGEPRNRDLFVSIEPAGLFGFSVEWRTTIYKANDKPVRNIQIIDFEPARRPNVYSTMPAPSESANTEQGEGPEVPNPADGAPYAWARVVGKTLTVNLLTIEDNGDYVIQTYDRTLTDKGMTLEFMRVRNGQIEQQIKGTLNRVEG